MQMQVGCVSVERAEGGEGWDVQILSTFIKICVAHKHWLQLVRTIQLHWYGNCK